MVQKQKHKINRNLSKHLFVRLYQSNFRHKLSMSDTILDFDKEQPLQFFLYGNTEQVTSRKFRNLDEVFLEHKCVPALYFTMRYLAYLQQEDLTEDITIQDIFKLAMLTDADRRKHPNSSQFKFAYVDDLRRKEIQVYENYYRILIWRSLVPADLEFSRRLEDCLEYVSPSNNIQLPDGTSLKSPLISEKQANKTATSTILTDDLYTYYKNLKQAEDDMLAEIGLPKVAHFDGERFVVILDDSAICPMLDISEANVSITFPKTGTAVYPCNYIPSYELQQKSLINNRYFNSRVGFFNSRHQYAVSFTMKMMNDGKIKNRLVSDTLQEYRIKRSKLRSKHNNAITALSDMLSVMMKAACGKEVLVLHESTNGYIASVFKINDNKQFRDTKLSTYAIIYDNDFNELYRTSYYTDFYADADFVRGFDDLRGKKDYLKYRDTMIDETFRRIVMTKRIISIDYVSTNINKQVQDIVSLYKCKTGIFKQYVYMLDLFNQNLSTILHANSIYKYVDILKKHVSRNGFADIRNYEESVKIITDGLREDSIDSQSIDYSELGIVDGPSVWRNIVQYRDFDGNRINTENYAAPIWHIPFGDCNYLKNEDIPEVQHALYLHSQQWQDNAKIKDI